MPRELSPATALGHPAPSVKPAEVRIGISGWKYPPWRTVFYPTGLAQHRELAFAAEAMRSIEINGSFYSLQRPSSYQAWYAETPADFLFAVKGGRFITHNKKLRGCEGALANFFASGVLALEEKLGPVLWQLPPQLGYDRRRLEEFFAILPRTTEAAAKLASNHDERLKHGVYLTPREDRPMRHALEVRHESFHTPELKEVLRANGIGLVVADTAGKWPFLEDVTASFVYARLHGSKKLYASGYTRAELDAWSEKIVRWRDTGNDVYVYFDNDVKVRAPFDAMNLAARLGQCPRVTFPRALHQQAEKRRGVEEVRTTWDRWRKTA